MKTVLTQALCDDRQTFALRHACEDCVYFNGKAEACSHGYPTETHRKAAFDQGSGYAMFCKEFELV